MTSAEILEQIKDIPGWFDEENIKMFQTVELLNTPLIVEIGTYCGRSTKALKAMHPGAMIISCDPVDEPERVKGGYKFYKGKGQDLKVRGKIDLLFIDSSHLYNDTKELFERFKDQADVIVFHDYAFESSDADGVRQFVRELGNCELFETGLYGGAIWRKP